MMMISAILMFAANFSFGAYAESAKALFFTPSASSEVTLDEAHLKSWLKDQKAVQKKLAKAAKEAKPMDSDGGLSDLRDAMGHKSDAATLPKKIAQSNSTERRALLERLPGMEPPPFESCRTLENCPEAPAMLHVNNPAFLENTVAAILRPWMLLQKARQKEFGVAVSQNSGDRIVRLQLEGLSDAGLEVHVSAVPLGGINVSLKGRKDPSALYVSERHSVLASMASAQ